MTDPRPERRAYFASLATPDLIVCATIERGSFTPGDLQLIQEELLRRGLDPTRLAHPGTTALPFAGPTPEFYSGPLPSAGRWWSEGWRLSKTHLNFLALLTLALFIPAFFLSFSVGEVHSWAMSFSLVAHVLIYLGLDSLFAAATLRGLCRRMTTGRCSVGRAVALGLERWGWVFKNSVKAAAIALGAPFGLIVVGASADQGGLIALGIILFLYPGVYLFLRYAWVQPIAALDATQENPLQKSKDLMEGRYSKVFVFLLSTFVIGWLAIVAGLILEGILPGILLEEFASGFVWAGFTVVLKTTFLVGYIHLNGRKGATEEKSEPAPVVGPGEMPPPPEL